MADAASGISQFQDAASADERLEAARRIRRVFSTIRKVRRLVWRPRPGWGGLADPKEGRDKPIVLSDKPSDVGGRRLTVHCRLVEEA